MGHGGAASIPADVSEVLSVDMGCVGNGLSCTEHQVSICAKDSRGPYNYEVVSNLIAAAKRQISILQLMSIHIMGLMQMSHSQPDMMSNMV